VRARGAALHGRNARLAPEAAAAPEQAGQGGPVRAGVERARAPKVPAGQPVVVNRRLEREALERALRQAVERVAAVDLPAVEEGAASPSD
jgi:hypothetical protein